MNDLNNVDEFELSEEEIRKFVKKAHWTLFVSILFAIVAVLLPNNGVNTYDFIDALINSKSALNDVTWAVIFFQSMYTILAIISLVRSPIAFIKVAVKRMTGKAYMLHENRKKSGIYCVYQAAAGTWATLFFAFFFGFLANGFYGADDVDSANNVLLCVIANVAAFLFAILMFNVVASKNLNPKVSQYIAPIIDVKDSKSTGIGKLDEQEQAENLEALLKYKKLLDDGVITKEEFEQKKKELLENE